MNDCIHKMQNNDVVSFSELGSSTLANKFFYYQPAVNGATHVYMYFLN